MSQRHTLSPVEPTVAAQQQALLDFAVSHSPTIFYIALLESGRPVKFISANVAEITGHAQSAFLGEGGYGRRFVHPDDLDDYAACRARLREIGELTHEYRFRCLDGRYKWFRDHLRLTEGEEGEIIGCMVDITAQKEAERERSSVSQLFHEAVETLRNGFSVVDTEGRLVACNSALTRNLDLDPKSFIGKPHSDLLRKALVHMVSFDGESVSPSPEWVARIDARMASVPEAPVEIEMKDGRWVLLTSHPTSAGGRVNIATDISIVKEAERELRASEHHFRHMVEQNPLPVCLIDIDDETIAYASPAAAELLGLAWPLATTLTLAELCCEDQSRREMLARTRMDGTLTNYELQLCRADGEGVWVALSNRLVDLQGRQIAIAGMVELTERKRREKALREAEQAVRQREHLARMLVEHHPSPVWMVELESGRILYESPTAAELTERVWGNNEEAFVNQFYADPDARVRFVEDLRSNRSLRNYEIEFRRRDGSTFWASANSRLIEHDGKELHITGWLDLTERREREAAVRRAHEMLEDAVESLSDGFALYDADDRLVMFNSRYREYNDANAAMLVPGMPFADLIRAGAALGEYPGDAAVVEQWLSEDRAQRAASRRVENFEFRKTDGRWFSYSSQPTRQGGAVISLSEISARKEMERALRESEAAVRQLLEASPVPLTLSRLSDGQIIYESPAAQQLFGSDDGDRHGATLWRGIDGEPSPRYLEDLHRDGMIENVEMEFRRRDGSSFWAALSAKLIELMGEEMIVSSAFDLTEWRAVEAEMARQREALHQSEKLGALGQLLASVAHELNNPLSVLVGQAVLLKETTTDASVQARAERIGKAADRCARIVRTFLAMARQQPRESTPTDPNSLIETALEVTGYALRASGIDVSVFLGKGLPPVLVDPDQMTQVFTNLIVNAEQVLREIDGPRRLRLTSRYLRQSNQIVFKIKDSGPGVPEEIRRRIFEPFFTTKGVGEGTGIGLAICHRILESHGGKIKIEQTPGGGATFVVRLPVPEGQQVDDDRPPEDEVATPRLSILVVDDEVEVAELVAEVLINDGHAVAVAHSGSEAMQAIEGRGFDVVLSDFRMPNMDGPGLLRALRRERPELVASLAFMTGDKLSPDVDRVLKTSGRPYIEKPITPDDVRALVQQVMEQRSV